MDSPRLYTDLADWWPLLSAPAEYAEEAAIYLDALVAACARRPRTLLELGSGGGNNASHMKGRFEEVVLVDRSPGMLAVSRALNPGCEHVEGDMRTVRLGRQFDCVFVHDAVCYMTTEDDLRRAVETSFIPSVMPFEQPRIETRPLPGAPASRATLWPACPLRTWP
jgi:SAM-dependent methyltransferase